MRERANHSKLLYKKIDEILLKDWDPIGIQDIPEARDEYSAYISPVYKLIISEKSENEIFEYLWEVELEHMGLSGNKQQTKIVARKLSELHARGNRLH